jgi:DNA-binding transcriptional LysR family regulator
MSLRMAEEVGQIAYKNNRMNQIKGFYYTVQNDGNITKTAEIIGRTASAISQQIKSLERDLDTILFHRHKKPMTLTDSGKRFYSKVAPLFQQMEGLYEEFKAENTEAESSKIDIAANHTSILYILPSLLRRYKNLHPTAEITIRNISRDNAMEQLINNKIDVMLYPMQDVPSECIFVPIVDYDPILLVRKDHPLATKKDLTLDDVANYNLVRIDPHLITLPLFEQTLKKYNIRSNIHFEFSDWEILKKFVRANLGVAIISNICIEPHEDILVGRKLPQYFPPMPYGLVYKKGKEQIRNINQFIQVTVEGNYETCT